MAWYEISLNIRVDDPPPVEPFEFIGWLRNCLDDPEIIMEGLTLQAPKELT